MGSATAFFNSVRTSFTLENAHVLERNGKIHIYRTCTHLGVSRALAMGTRISRASGTGTGTAITKTAEAIAARATAKGAKRMMSSSKRRESELWGKRTWYSPGFLCRVYVLSRPVQFLK